MLASLQQRHPDIVEGTSRLSMNENEGRDEAMEHLLLSLSIVGRIRYPVAYFLDTISAENSASRRELRIGHGGCVNGREW